MVNRLVSVNIPTRNSEKTIGATLRSVKEQTYDKIEIIVTDSNSTDNTLAIAEDFGVKIITTHKKLLGSRLEGVKNSKGDYVLLLDSDHVLMPHAIDNAVDMMKSHDILYFEEYSYYPHTWIEKLFEADRRFINSSIDDLIDPIEGVLLARFFKRDILVKAFEKIPNDILQFVIAHDHAIINYEVFKLTNKVTMIPRAVLHQEPKLLLELWQKNFRYGKSTRALVRSGYYGNLLKRKTRFRRGAFSNRRGVASSLLLALKSPPYFIGYFLG